MEDPLVSIDFAAQPVDQNVNYIGLRIETVIENVLEDHRFGHRPVHVAHQILEQRKFARL
jgi:hypothetical protein